MKENISGGVSKCPAVPLNETTVLYALHMINISVGCIWP